jgi:hypothetical protein
MKGRALPYEDHMDFRLTDPAMAIASAFESRVLYTPPPPSFVSLALERFFGMARCGQIKRSGELNALQRRHPTQPLIHHRKALPIFAAFGLRYIHTLVRKWAALGTGSGCAPQVGMRPAEW